MDPLGSASLHDPEAAPAVWGPGATLLWTVVIWIAFHVVQTMAALVYAGSTMRDLPRAKLGAALHGLTFDGTFLSFATFASLLVCVPLIAGVAKLKRRSKLKDYLGLTIPHLRQVLNGVSSPAFFAQWPSCSSPCRTGKHRIFSSGCTAPLIHDGFCGWRSRSPGPSSKRSFTAVFSSQVSPPRVFAGMAPL